MPRSGGRRAGLLGLVISVLLMAPCAGQAATVGEVAAFGAGGAGQLGDGSTADSSTPTHVLGLGGTATLRDVTTVAAGSNNSYAVLANGQLAAWGDNSDGELGDGTTTQRDTPVLVTSTGGTGTLSNVTAAGGGYDDALALLGDGSVLAWGDNADGELGDGTTTNRSTPVAVTGVGGVADLSDVDSIAVGGFHDEALVGADGEIVTWGSDQYGQLGDGSTTQQSSPVSVIAPGSTRTSGDELTGATAITAGVFGGLALLRNGTVVSWGQSHLGQLGNGSLGQSDVPVFVEGVDGTGDLGNVAAIASGGYHDLALLEDGSLVAWGTDANGELGDDGADSGNGCGCAATPVPVQGLTNVVAIAAGQFSSYAITSDGSVWAWGDDSNGELGDGETADADVPQKISGLSALSVASSVYASHAVVLEAEPPVETALPDVTGTPAVGATLTASSGTWSGTAPITYSYQWQRCSNGCTDIDAATGTTYTPTAADAGSELRVQVTATNAAGSPNADSSQTSEVPAVADGVTTASETATTPTTTTPVTATTPTTPTTSANPSPGSSPGSSPSPVGSGIGRSVAHSGAHTRRSPTTAAGASAGHSSSGGRSAHVGGVTRRGRRAASRSAPAPRRSHTVGVRGRGPRRAGSRSPREPGNPQRSLIADSLLRPNHLHLSATDIERSVGIAVLLIALLGFPAALFNRTVEQNRQTIAGWFSPLQRVMSAPRKGVTGRLLGLAVTSVVVGTLIHAFLEPGFPSRPGSVAYVLGMLLGFAAIVINKSVNTRLAVRSRPGQTASGWVVYPEQIGISIVFVAVSRLGHFVPGLMLGKQGDYGQDGMEPDDRGRLVFRTFVSLGLISLAAWIASVPVAAAAEKPGATTLTLMADSALTVITVAGIETLVFELAPLYFLDGHQLRRWSPRRWAGLWAAAIFWFALVVINPALYAKDAQASLLWLILLFVLEAAISVTLWAYFALRYRREQRDKAAAEATLQAGAAATPETPAIAGQQEADASAPAPAPAPALDPAAAEPSPGPPDPAAEPERADRPPPTPVPTPTPTPRSPSTTPNT